jgi:hypothetical protein
MSNKDIPKDSEELPAKRPSAMRFAQCTFCKARHPPPSGDQCMMALLDASERGEASSTAKRTQRKPTATIVHEASGGDDIDEQTQQEEEPEEPSIDPAYAHLTNFMVAFFQKVDKNFQNINSQLSQMRGEAGGCRPKQPQAQRQQQVQLPSPSPAPSPAVYHQISEVPARSPSLVPRLSTLRCNPTLTRQAQDLVDGLDNTVAGTSVCDKFSKQGWARSGGELAPRVPTPWPQDHVIGQGRRYKLFHYGGGGGVICD